MAERELLHSLPRRAYWDEAFFERERHAIFWDEWFYVGRAGALDVPGSFRVVEVAGESLIVIRGEDGLYAHRNFCRHRGSRLLCGAGVQRGAIRCPYHGWAYAHDGTLVASPFVETADVPDDARRLYAVAASSWGGFLFLNLRRDGPRQSLDESLGPVPRRLERYPLTELRAARTIRYEIAANWKVLLENYNECYHCAGVHPELCRVVPAFKARGGSGLDWDAGIPHREGAWTFTFSGTTNRAPFAALDDDERVRHKGELIYPNFMLSLSAEHVAAFCVWPVAPDRTVVDCDFLFHPEEMAKPDFDPSDAVDFWDVTNRQDWAICENVQAGMRSEAFAYGYYAPMEDYSLDIRRYIARKLGDDAIAL